jgi:hypothetical protein
MNKRAIFSGVLAAALIAPLTSQARDIGGDTVRGAAKGASSRPGEPPPEALTEPDVNVSAHPAPPIQPARRASANGQTVRAGGAPRGATTARPAVDGGAGV